MSIADKLTLLASSKEALRVKLGLPKSLPFGEYVNYLPEWSPKYLFRGGKQGVWYDPSDLSTLYQDVAGTVPVTKDGDPVALMKDKSGNGNHATQTVSTSRPVYKTDGVLHWLAFDGVDDSLSSVPVNFSATEVASAFFARQIVANSGATNLLFGDNVTSAGSFGEYQRTTYFGAPTVALNGTALTIAQVTNASTALSNSVISIRLDLSLETSRQEIDLKVNGAYPSLGYGGAASAGGGNFGTHPIRIGGATPTISNMIFRGLVIVNTYSTIEQVSAIESYLAAKSGVIL